MSLNARDPQFGAKLTAYALGELEGRELKEVEEAVAKNLSLQREVAAIREVVSTLTRELEREPAPGLTHEQRARITEGEPESKVASWLRAFWAGMTPMRLVPVLAIGIIAFGYFGPFSQVLNNRVANAPLYKTAARAAGGPDALGAKDTREDARRKGTTLPESNSSLEAKAQLEAMSNARPEPAAKPKPLAKAMAAKSVALSVGDKNAAPMDDLASAGAPAPAEVPAPTQAVPAAMSPPAMEGRTSSVAGKEGSGGRAFGRVGTVATNIGVARKGYAKKKEAQAQKIPSGAGLDEADGVKLMRDAYSDNEAYDRIVDNEFKKVAQEPLSTFSIDVDTGSYSNLRRFLTGGSLPPKDAARIEELVNYFPYSYEAPKKGTTDPFAVNVEINQAPWNPEHRLVRIGLKGRELDNGRRPPSNLVFLIDVSGSMFEPNKLPWVKDSLKMLTNQLGENDLVSIVVYAGNTGLLLPATRGTHKKDIIEAIEHMEAGGSTNGGQGIELAYRVAREHFIQGGTNRVILCTDGDWNVGVTSQGELTRLIEKKAKEGVFLSVLGFGMGNLKDATMVKLADKGHGHYAYIDTLGESKKVLVEEIGSTLVTIAKDVKIQVEFNPAEVGAFRLLGYEKRIMAHEDFGDDTKDAGVIGAGHTVTALYEVVPAGKHVDTPSVDPLRYQKPKAQTDAAKSGELMTLKLRYKAPEDGSSKLTTFPIKDEGKRQSQASKDFKFQSAVAAFGMLLRDSPFKGGATYEQVIDLAQSGRGDDKQGYRSEFIELVRKAKSLSGAR